MMKFISIAKWPRTDVSLPGAENESRNTHDTPEEALAVTRRLMREGVGDAMKFFPLEVRVEVEDDDYSDMYQIKVRGADGTVWYWNQGMAIYIRDQAEELADRNVRLFPSCKHEVVPYDPTHDNHRKA